MKWFVLKNEEVLGPFEKETALIASDDSSLIWGADLNEWLNKSDWQKYLTRSKATPATPQITQWYYTINKERFGPMNKKALISALGRSNELNKVFLWNKDLPTWEKFYSFTDLVKEVGKVARANTRYKLTETIMITPVSTEEESPSFMCKTVSISKEGLGIINFPQDMSIGSEINLNLDFLNPEKGLTVRGKFISQTDKQANIKFVELKGEPHALLISFLKNLSEEHLIKAPKAA